MTTIGGTAYSPCPSAPSSRSPSASSQPQARSAKQAPTQMKSLPIPDEADMTSSSGSDSSTSNDSDDADNDEQPKSKLQHNFHEPGDLRSRVSTFLSRLADEPADKGEVIEILDDDDGDEEEEEDKVEDDAQAGQLVQIDLALGVLSQQDADVDDGRDIRLANDESDSDDSRARSGDEDTRKRTGGVLADLKSIGRQDDAVKWQRKTKRKIEEVG